MSNLKSIGDFFGGLSCAPTSQPDRETNYKGRCNSQLLQSRQRIVHLLYVRNYFKISQNFGHLWGRYQNKWSDIILFELEVVLNKICPSTCQILSQSVTFHESYTAQTSDQNFGRSKWYISSSLSRRYINKKVRNFF